MLKRWWETFALVVAIVLAFYTGFRLPSTWVATQASLSLFDGFHKRFVVGTLLRPLAVATGYNYWLFAAYGFVLLAGVLAVLVYNARRARLATRRWLVIAWLLLPTGGFLFHEVGYFEQINYLLLFASIALLNRQRPLAAACLIAITPFVHETSLVTTTPIFGLVALRTLPLRRAIVVTAIPAACAAVALWIPPASDTAAATLTQTLSHASFALRPDAIPTASFSLFRDHVMTMYVLSFAVFTTAMFTVLWFADGKLATNRLVTAASFAAVALPAILIYAGWDGNRWAFCLITNFFVVLWICLEGRDHELAAAPLAVLAVTVLVLTHFTIFYFDNFVPRDLTYPSLHAFVSDFGALFTTATR